MHTVCVSVYMYVHLLLYVCVIGDGRFQQLWGVGVGGGGGVFAVTVAYWGR